MAVIGKTKEIFIDRKGAKGLAPIEIDEILATLREAKNKGLLPALTYEANRRTWLFGKDPMYVWPKSGITSKLALGRIAVKIRKVLRSQYGPKYSVGLI